MTDTPSSRSAMLSRVDDMQTIWSSLVAEVGDAIDIPGPMGDWTFKDVAYHLNGWRIVTVNKLEAAARGGELPAPPWPSELEMVGDEDAQTDSINTWFHEQGQQHSYADILAEANEQFDRLRTAIEAIPEESFAEPGVYPWLGHHTLSDVLRGSWEHLTEEHLRPVRDWVTHRKYNLA